MAGLFHKVIVYDEMRLPGLPAAGTPQAYDLQTKYTATIADYTYSIEQLNRAILERDTMRIDFFEEELERLHTVMLHYSTQLKLHGLIS
jgi:hypothetical protein